MDLIVHLILAHQLQTHAMRLELLDQHPQQLLQLFMKEVLVILHQTSAIHH